MSSFSKAMDALEVAQRAVNLSPAQAKAIAVMGTWTNREPSIGRNVWISPRDAAFGFATLRASTINVLVTKKLVERQDTSLRLRLTEYGWDVYYGIMDVLIQTQWDGNTVYQDEGDVPADLDVDEGPYPTEDGDNEDYEEIEFEKLRDIEDEVVTPPKKPKKKRRRRKQQARSKKSDPVEDEDESKLTQVSAVAANIMNATLGRKVEELTKKIEDLQRKAQTKEREKYLPSKRWQSKKKATPPEDWDDDSDPLGDFPVEKRKKPRGRPKKKTSFAEATVDAWLDANEDDDWDEDPPKNVPVKQRKKRGRPRKKTPRAEETIAEVSKMSSRAQKGWETRRKREEKKKVEDAQRILLEAVAKVKEIAEASQKIEDAEVGLIGRASPLFDEEF